MTGLRQHLLGERAREDRVHLRVRPDDVGRHGEPGGGIPHVPRARSARSSARPPTGWPAGPTAPSARCRARASAGARRAPRRRSGRRTTRSWLARTMSRSRGARWIAGSMSTSRSVHAGVGCRRDGRRRAAERMARPRGPTRRPSPGRVAAQVGRVRVDRVVERARRDAVSAQVDGVRVPAGVGEGDAVAPHERAVRAESVDEQRAALGRRIAPRQAGERERCGHAHQPTSGPTAPRAGP